MTPPAAGPALAWLRDARWLTAQRAALYGGLLGLVPAAFLVVALLRMAGEAGHEVRGIDFAGFYSAARLALEGNPAAAWDRAVHAAAHGGSLEGGYFIFVYPPIFLLYCLPFGLLPFAAAYFAWIGLTGALCIAALAAYRAAPWWVVALLVILAPGAVQNVANGQNAFLTAAIFAMAGLALDRRPGMAGSVFAALCYKPQFGLVVVPALLAARRWRVLAIGALAAAALVLATIAVLGADAWWAFIAGTRQAVSVVADGLVPFWQMQSAYGVLAALGVPHGIAQAAQLAVTCVVLVVVTRIAWRRPGGRAEVAAMAAGAPLVTPYLLAYDQTLLLMPMMWLWSEARRTGYLPWEKFALVAAYLLPALSIFLGLAVGVSTGPLTPLLLLALVARRVRGLRA